ncbi:MAG TPA: MFS transporter [Ktedonobacterales bacterium]|nr:MFS transporter [Ktedonobacterales bacterium]
MDRPKLNAPVSRTAARKEEISAPRPPIMTRMLVLLFVSSIGSATGFYLLLSVVPLYATSGESGGDVAAGLTTAALMFSTVVGELATPRLVARFGYRLVFAAALILLGVPALVLTASASLAVIIVVCLVRGLGFAVTVVVGSALVALFVPHERQGEGLGLYGVVVGIPSVVALPLGVWLAQHVGYSPVFVAGAVATLCGLIVVPGLSSRTSASEQPLGVLAGMRTPSLARPALIFSTTTIAAGVVYTFLPLAVTSGTGNVAALALLVQAVAATLTRWWAGRYGDRHGSGTLLMPGILVAGIGMLGLIVADNPAVVVAGMVLFGAGFGVTQNASLMLLFERVSTSGYGAVSALWNLAYDAGLGVGAAGFGVLAAQTGYPPAFALVAVLVLAALVPAWRERPARRSYGAVAP